ncbi:hypothetical protein BGZ96_003053 [Linnemannia gamsii]|uniref:F-box domain-containing protein n=1 Tax=Linnemannia gamsii TaxID=64522 RepID=A0ABQ7K7D2_9FUNG|nr:hypothetical protein BGZ96_003053 [Linnemannia gamsii]
MTTASSTHTQGNATRMNMRAVAITQPITVTVDPNAPWTSPMPATVSSAALRTTVFSFMANFTQDTHPGSPPSHASASTTTSASSRFIAAATTTSTAAQVAQMSSSTRTSGSEVTITTASTNTSTLPTLPRSRSIILVGTSTSVALPPSPVLVPAPSPSLRPLYLHLPPTSLKQPADVLPLVPSSASSSSSSVPWSSPVPAPSLTSYSLSSPTTILATKRKSASAVTITDDSDSSPPPTKATKVSRHLSPSSTPSDQRRMKRLPSEVLLVVARFLELKDIVECMLVCKSWHQALCLILWSDIGRVQWRKVTFPLNDMEVDDDESFNHRLRQVRKLVWDERFNVAVTSERIAAMLRLMPGLTDLSLTASVFRPPRTLLGLLKNLRMLNRLKSLHLHFSSFHGEDALPINQVIHGCHDLEVLSVNGTRFREETQEELDAHPQPWSLTSLSVPRTHLSLLQRCPELRALELTSHPNIDVEINLQPIARCPRLERLKFVGSDGFIVSDFEAVVPTMRCLTSLCIEHIHQQQFGNLEPLTEIANVPELRELELGRVMIHGEELLTMTNQLMIFGILRGRPNLRKFALKGFTIDAASFFTMMEDGHSVPSCLCPQLRELWLEIHVVESSQNVMEQTWELVYRHVARIGDLNSLTLRSAHLNISPRAGFNLLANTGKLKELKLSNPNSRSWTAAEMQLLMNVAPHLKSLDLSPAINHSNVNGWLRLNGKAYLIK